MIKLYDKNNVGKVVIPDIKWRLCKFQLINGKWLERRFSNHRQLHKFLVKVNPANCYQSVSLINPHNKNKRFKSEMFIDLDTLDIKNLNLCLKLIKKKNKTINRILNSGGGFHIFLNEQIRYRAPFLNYLKENGVNVDFRVHDRKRVSRICGTINMNKKGKLCHTLSSLKDGIVSEMFANSHDDKTTPPKHRLPDGVTNPGLPDRFYFRFMLCKNKKSNVYFKKYRKDFKKILKKWKYLNSRYKLGTCLLIDYGTEYGLLGVKSHSTRRLKKIDKRWKKQLIRTSPYSDGKKAISRAPKAVMLLESDYSGNESQFHGWYINRLLGYEYFKDTKKPQLFMGEFGR